MKPTRIPPFAFAFMLATLALGCSTSESADTGSPADGADGSSSDSEADGTPRDGGDDPSEDGNDTEDGSDGDSEDAGGGDGTSADGTDDPAGSFVAAHGALRAEGNRVVDEHGGAVQLRGMSLFWSQWTDFYRAENVDVLADDWNATVVRAAMGVENDGGYLQTAQPNIDKVKLIVDRAIARGIYVIIDWHDHHAQDHASQANDFFTQMADLYGNEPSVIFEIYNEPVDVDWQTVKSYAETVIATIRGRGANNLVIVGTPTWSQDVDLAAEAPITSDDNVAYTLHFYANTHRAALRDKAKTALDRGIPLFVTEWGTCSADGNGSIDDPETRTWLGFLAEHAIGWANWSLNNKDEACSALVPSSAASGPWADDQLTASGRLVKSLIAP